MCARERAYACVFYLFIFNSAFTFLSVFCSECLSLRLYDSKTTKASSPTLHDILLYNTPLAFRSLNKQQCLFLSIFILYLLQNKKSYFCPFFQEKRNWSCSGKKSTQFDFVCFLLLWSCVCLCCDTFESLLFIFDAWKSIHLQHFTFDIFLWPITKCITSYRQDVVFSQSCFFLYVASLVTVYHNSPCSLLSCDESHPNLIFQHLTSIQLVCHKSLFGRAASHVVSVCGGLKYSDPQLKVISAEILLWYKIA